MVTGAERSASRSVRGGRRNPIFVRERKVFSLKQKRGRARTRVVVTHSIYGAVGNQRIDSEKS